MAEPTVDGSVPSLASGGNDAVSLGRITQRTTPGSVAHVLRDAILEGRLRPGSQLRETHLAADLGVSRAPLREALAQLAEEGLVNKIPFKGAFVAEVSAESIAEIASLRKRLEPYAIELALPRLRGATRIKVTRPLEDMTIGADTNDAAATINAHMGFHRAFYELRSQASAGSLEELGSAAAAVLLGRPAVVRRPARHGRRPSTASGHHRHR